MLSTKLTAQKALIFRITHRDNLEWILRNGLHCEKGRRDPNFVSIGNPDLIDRRRSRLVPVPPGGLLSDYVPFYFTPSSPMLMNIQTGWGGVERRKNEEIVVIVSSLPALKANGVRYLFTDRHAYLAAAAFYDDDSTLAPKRSTSAHFSNVTSRETPNTRRSSTATWPKHWLTSSCPSPRSSALAATLPTFAIPLPNSVPTSVFP